MCGALDERIGEVKMLVGKGGSYAGSRSRVLEDGRKGFGGPV